jgi:2-dehydropantoate 2-reductase
MWIDLFNHAGIETMEAPSYEALKWSKALLNIVANATSAIVDRPPGTVYRDDLLYKLEVRMLRETTAVMSALGIEVVDLPGSPARRLAAAVRHVPGFLLKPILTRLVARGRGDKMPSFQLDLASGSGKSEVSYHNGAIARAGQRARIPTPVNATLDRVLMGLTLGSLDRQDFTGNAPRLVEEVAFTEESASYAAQ